MDLLVDTFNEILEEVLSAKRGHFLLDINNELLGLSTFTVNGQLSGYGKVKFWRAVDKMLERFDCYEILMRPMSSLEKEQARRCLEEQQARNTHDNDKVQKIQTPGRVPVITHGHRFFKKNKCGKKKW